MKFGLTIAKVDGIRFPSLEVDMVSTVATGVESVESNQRVGEYTLGGNIGEVLLPTPMFSLNISGAGIFAVNGVYTYDGTLFLKGSYRCWYNSSLSKWEIYVHEVVPYTGPLPAPAPTYVDKALYENPAPDGNPPASGWLLGDYGYVQQVELTLEGATQLLHLPTRSSPFFNSRPRYLATFAESPSNYQVDCYYEGTRWKAAFQYSVDTPILVHYNNSTDFRPPASDWETEYETGVDLTISNTDEGLPTTTLIEN